MSDNNNTKKHLPCIDNVLASASPCTNNTCKFWCDGNNESYNCAIIASNNSTMTLQDVANFFNLSRMRICQIEKSAYKKITETIKNKKIDISEISVKLLRLLIFCLSFSLAFQQM